MGYLDNAGLAHFTAWVKERLAGKQNAITAGDGISKTGDTISVTIPSRALTKAEYDSLTEAEKLADVLYVITDDNTQTGGASFSLAVAKPPGTQIVGESFDPSGMEVNAVFGEKNLPVNHDYLQYSPSGPLTSDTEAVDITLELDGATATVSQPLEIISSLVFGVCWDYGSPGTKLARLTPETDPNGLVTVSVDADPSAAVGTGAGSSPFDHYMPWAGMEEYNIINGEAQYRQGDEGFSRTDHDTFVYIPEFWYQCIDDAENSKRYWYVSPKATAGLLHHPGSGQYIGKYNFTSGCTSKSGLRPMTGLSLSNARSGAASRGTGYMQFDYAAWSAVWILYLVEFADWDSQAVVGHGVTNAGPSNTGGTDIMVYHTGTVNSSGNAQIQYRGIEDIWGNVWDWLDGIAFSGSNASLCEDPAEYGNMASYTEISAALPGTSGFISALEFISEFPFAFVPKAVGGSAKSYISDMYTEGGSANSLIIGGAYSNIESGYAGMFWFYRYSGSASTIGGRLQFRAVEEGA